MRSIASISFASLALISLTNCGLFGSAAASQTAAAAPSNVIVPDHIYTQEEINYVMYNAVKREFVDNCPDKKPCAKTIQLDSDKWECKPVVQPAAVVPAPPVEKTEKVKK